MKSYRVKILFIIIIMLLWRSPHPPLETSRTFFDTAEAPGALFIVQALRFSAVSKNEFSAGMYMNSRFIVSDTMRNSTSLILLSRTL